MDILGNWPSFYEEIDGTRSPSAYTGTGETQTRTHNDANEIASMDRRWHNEHLRE